MATAFAGGIIGFLGRDTLEMLVVFFVLCGLPGVVGYYWEIDWLLHGAAVLFVGVVSGYITGFLGPLAGPVAALYIAAAFIPRTLFFHPETGFSIGETRVVAAGTGFTDRKTAETRGVDLQRLEPFVFSLAIAPRVKLRNRNRRLSAIPVLFEMMNDSFVPVIASSVFARQLEGPHQLSLWVKSPAGGRIFRRDFKMRRSYGAGAVERQQVDWPIGPKIRPGRYEVELVVVGDSRYLLKGRRIVVLE